MEGFTNRKRKNNIPRIDPCLRHFRHREKTARLLAGLIYGLGSVFVTSSGVQAQAVSCVDIPNLSVSLADHTLGGSVDSSARPAITLAAGDVVTLTATLNLGGGIASGTITASPGSVQNVLIGTVTPTGTIQFTAAASGSYSITLTADGGATNTVELSFSATCAAGAGGGTTDAESGTDAGVRTSDTGRMGTGADEFPDYPDFEAERARIEALYDAAIEAEFERRRQLVEERGALIESYEFARERTVEIVAELDRARRRYGEDDPRTIRLENQFQISFAAVENSEISSEIRQINTEIESVDLRVSDLRSKRREELNSLERQKSVVTAGSRSFYISSQNVAGSGAGSVMWTRFQLSALNGTLDRKGAAIHAQLGFVRPVGEGASFGYFGSIFVSNTSSTTLGTSDNSVGLGGGVFYKFPVNGKLTGGLSATYERSNNRATIGVANGSFARDLVTLDASLTGRAKLVEGYFLTPSVNLGFTYSNRAQYTDSTATLIPGRIDRALVASFNLDATRVVELDGRRAKSVTLNFGGGIDANLSGSNTLTFTSGNTLIAKAIEGRIYGRADYRMKNGAIWSLSVGVGGIGAATQSYTAAAKYSLSF